MKTNLTILVVAAFMAMSGCVTQRGYSRTGAMRKDVDQANMKLQLAQLADRVESMKIGQQKIYEDLDALRVEIKGARDKDRALEARLEEIGRDLKVNEAAMRKNKAEIVSAIKALSGSVSAAPVQGGYEHTVKSGETLSQIAKAYNVAIGVIVRENKLKNANAIRVGQKLFIPE